ncbi:MAG: AIR synthase related protein [Minisyncoccia bacterium]
MGKSEYAKAGVDYTQLEPFKQAMIAMGKRTLSFPNRRGVYVNNDVLHAHGAVYEYRGGLPHLWCKTQEGLGNKNWIAEWMYQNAGTGRTYYETIGIDTALMAVNDLIAQGAMPVIFTDEVAVGDAAWFSDEKRSHDLAEGFFKICKEVGMALPAGESPALKYLMKPEPPVLAAPSLSGCATGIIAPNTNLITGKELAPGCHIVGAASSGLHANGISLVIKRALALPDKFLTKLPNGTTLGEEALIPTRSYVALVEALQNAHVRIAAILPGTGDGIGKLAFDKRPFTYRIQNWPAVPPLFQFMRGLGVSLRDCLKTFNWGVGYYLFVPKEEVDRTVSLGKKAGCELFDLGVVEEGKREVVFEPEDIILQPPGEE